MLTAKTPPTEVSLGTTSDTSDGLFCTCGTHSDTPRARTRQMQLKQQTDESREQNIKGLAVNPLFMKLSLGNDRAVMFALL